MNPLNILLYYVEFGWNWVVFKFAICEGSAKWHLQGRCTLMRWQRNGQQKFFKFMQKWIDNSWTTCHVMRSQGKRQLVPFLRSHLLSTVLLLLGGNLKTGIGRPIGNSLRKSLFVKLKKLPVGFSRKRQFPAFSWVAYSWEEANRKINEFLKNECSHSSRIHCRFVAISGRVHTHQHSWTLPRSRDPCVLCDRSYSA